MDKLIGHALGELQIAVSVSIRVWAAWWREKMRVGPRADERVRPTVRVPRLGRKIDQKHSSPAPSMSAILDLVGDRARIAEDLEGPIIATIHARKVLYTGRG